MYKHHSDEGIVILSFCIKTTPKSMSSEIFGMGMQETGVVGQAWLGISKFKTQPRVGEKLPKKRTGSTSFERIEAVAYDISASSDCGSN